MPACRGTGPCACATVPPTRSLPAPALVLCVSRLDCALLCSSVRLLCHFSVRQSAAARETAAHRCSALLDSPPHTHTHRTHMSGMMPGGKHAATNATDKGREVRSTAQRQRRCRAEGRRNLQPAEWNSRRDEASDANRSCSDSSVGRSRVGGRRHSQRRLNPQPPCFSLLSRLAMLSAPA